MLKDLIYDHVKDKMRRSVFDISLRPSLIQETFRYDPITDKERNAIMEWVHLSSTASSIGTHQRPEGQDAGVHLPPPGACPNIFYPYYKILA